METGYKIENYNTYGSSEIVVCNFDFDNTVVNYGYWKTANKYDFTNSIGKWKIKPKTTEL